MSIKRAWSMRPFPLLVTSFSPFWFIPCYSLHWSLYDVTSPFWHYLYINLTLILKLIWPKKACEGRERKKETVNYWETCRGFSPLPARLAAPHRLQETRLLSHETPHWLWQAANSHIPVQLISLFDTPERFHTKKVNLLSISPQKYRRHWRKHTRSTGKIGRASCRERV